MPRAVPRPNTRRKLTPHGLVTARVDAPTDQDSAIFDVFCRPLANQFEVSAQAMRIRLEELLLLRRVKGEMLF